MDQFSNLLSEHVRTYRGGMTELARKSALSRPSLYDALNGKSLPKTKTLERILLALDLPEKHSDEIRMQHQNRSALATRRKRENYRREKNSFIQTVSSYLLGKGLEISFSSTKGNADLIIRQVDDRIPILASQIIHDYPDTLGTLLTIMHEFNSKRGFVCLPGLTSSDRSQNSLFEKYGISILPYKRLPSKLMKAG
jgi:hypothetical protein